tara:strand:- start:26 stop:175 length:150 start_codon:yes stop_codon:yes gene_type:complete
LEKELQETKLKVLLKRLARAKKGCIFAAAKKDKRLSLRQKNRSSLTDLY